MNNVVTTRQSVAPKSIVLLKRSTKRYLGNHDEVERVVRQLSAQYNFSFRLYPDNPMPSPSETMDIFHDAAVVIAPHGAGFLNLLMIPSGADVIEVMTRKDVVLCYHALAYQLGHRWHGTMSQTELPAMTANVTHVYEVLRIFLENRNINRTLKLGQLNSS